MINLILIGGNRMEENQPVEYINQLSRKKKMKLFLFTEKIHLNKPTNNRILFKDFLIENQINYKTLKNINNEVNEIKGKLCPKSRNILLLVNCIWRINNKILNLFGKNAYNIHLGTLPNQVGAGGASWLRMIGARKSSISIHQLNSDYDSGKILLSEDFSLKKDFSLNDYYFHVRKKEKKAYEKFFDILIKNKLKLRKVSNKDFTYMPRLNTLTHGFIDWSWGAKDIVNFINAFGRPYKGASTFIKKKKYFISEAKFLNYSIKFHPFQSGIVIKKTKKSLFIATSNGLVNIIDLKDEKGKKVSLDKINLGVRFFTPSKYLDASKMNTSLHTGKGIVIKR